MESSVYATHIQVSEPATRAGRELTMAEALNEALRGEMERDARVFVMGEDVSLIGGIFGVTRGLRERFGEDRVRDTPISEATFVGAGVGAAIAGLRPVVEIQIFDFLAHKALYATKGAVPEAHYAIPLGKADVKRAGKDVTLVATQAMVSRALAAAADLEKEGVSVEVIDPRTLVPLDEATILTSVAKTGRLVIAHEAVKRGGWGAELAALVAERAIDVLDAPIVRVAARNVPMPYNDSLERATIPSQQDIAAAIRGLL